MINKTQHNAIKSNTSMSALNLYIYRHLIFLVAKMTQLMTTYDIAATGINIIVCLNSQ